MRRTVLGLAFVVGCGSEDTALPVEVAAPVGVDVPLQTTAIVHIAVPEVQEDEVRLAERAGLVVALYELGVADIQGTVGRVEGTAPSPGLAEVVETGAEPWSASLTVSAAPFAIGLTLCDMYTGCTEHVATDGSLEAPEPALAGLLEVTAERMVRPIAPGAPVDWATGQSEDPYAVLIAGRGAATLYGLRPPPPEGDVWDKRRDPVARAVLIDPEMPVGAWIAGRRAAADDREATSWFVRGAMARPSSVVLIADEAAVLGQQGKWPAAWRRWQDVEVRVGVDPRFVVPSAYAALRAADLPAAAARAARVDGADPRGARLRVEVAEAQGRIDELDGLLAQWQATDPADPAPVERRIALSVQAERYDDALALVEELSLRGEDVAARRQRIALLVAMGRWEEAAKRAGPELAPRLKARAGAAETGERPIVAVRLERAEPEPLPPAASAAPTLGELRRQADRADAWLTAADALGEATARLHNAWTTRVPPDGRVDCADEAIASLAGRSRRFGAGYREALEVARSEARLVAALRPSPTVAPLLTPADEARLDAIAAKVARHERIYVEMSAWHARHVGEKCPGDLAPAAGLPRAEPHAIDEDRSRATAVLVLRGQACTAGEPVEGPATLVLAGDRACVAAECPCDPRPVAPGAALGR